MAVYIVGAGDTLGNVSMLYGVPVQTIVELNGLPSADSIVPGLALYIPDNSLPIRSYRIKLGDAIWKLAQQYGTEESLILMANPGITPNQLYIGQNILIPSPLKLAMTTLGFIVPSAVNANLATLDSLSSELTYLAIVAYSMTEQGWAYKMVEDQPLVDRSNQRNVMPLLMIQNFTGENFSAELIGRVLENPEYRTNLVTSLVHLAKQGGYGGVSIDFEFIPPPRRKDFIVFLTDLKKSLGELILHVNVHAKTEDIPTNRIIGAYDYAGIARACDLVAVMTMDYGYPGGPPDPISPINWLEQVVQYSLTQIPAGKLQIAAPLYGYDKEVPSNTTKSLSVLAAQNQAIANWYSIQFDDISKAPWYRYWQGEMEHVVWFEDIRSYTELYQLVDRYQLSGVTFWQISLPAPQNWAYLRNNVTILLPIR
ncbi:glycosyl hydrolase family 18 protein [Pseudoneobacillus sp. C159]